MPDPIDIEFDPVDPDQVCGNYLRTCEMLGVEPVTRARAQGLIGEWNEVLSGRPGADGALADQRARGLIRRKMCAAFLVLCVAGRIRGQCHSRENQSRG